MSEPSHEWWAELRHGGMLVAPQVLDEFFPTEDPLDERAYERLRSEWLKLAPGTSDSGTTATRAFTEALLERFLGHSQGWQKAGSVADDYKAEGIAGERLRPDRVLTGGTRNARLAVWFDEAKRVGIGRGRRTHARAVELLRKTGIPLGLITNGRELRLVHVGPDYDAWAEWTIDTWFDEGEGRRTLAGLATILATGPEVAPIDCFIDAVDASRDRQGDLAQVLGEQVRQAIELLLHTLDERLSADPSSVEQLKTDPETGTFMPDDSLHDALYQGATRMIMRVVLILYAEARALLPATLETYHASYGVEGLYRLLNEADRDGREALAERYGAWPRIIALFHSIHRGSAHPDMPIFPYGGELFAPGDLTSPDPVRRSVAALEEAAPDDGTVLRLLRLLKVGRIRVRSGRSSRWVAGPVDFSDLRTEYIGIVYEGLLDYELRRAEADDPVVVLAVGRRPALPLSRLRSMGGKALNDLLKAFKKDAKASKGGDESDSESDEPDDAESEDIDEAEMEVTESVLADSGSIDEVMAWAREAVVTSGKVRKPRGRNPDLVAFERKRATEAGKLVESVVPANTLYLVASGNLRKGSGSFYTRPSIAVPLVQKALEPLCYESDREALRPRTPEEILDLKVCEPAMGSGSFLVAALRYLTEALAQSLQHHDRIQSTGDEATLVELPFGRPAAGTENEELIRVPPDDDRFDDSLRSQLKRHVVERCIYGVDLNPMAVELARLALWIETLDPELPFEFLDHKLKRGNSLVGSWFHLVDDYPVLGLAREAGDGRSGERSKSLKAHFAQAKKELPEVIAAKGGAMTLLSEGTAEAVDRVEPVRRAFRELHALPPEEREAAYRELRDAGEFEALKAELDAWSAIWFWPGDASPPPMPSEWDDRPAEATALVERLLAELGFFHWELEFPDVFAENRPGFDAILGNPPWDIAKPNSQEFFSRVDPLYRSYTKTEATRIQQELFAERAGLEDEWITYQGRFKSMSNFVKHSADPFDVSLGRSKAAQASREQWKEQRSSRPHLADPEHPYRHQGSADLNTYKLFLEASRHLLRDGGRLGMLVPSGIYTDKGTTDLRVLFLDECRWEWLYGFENRDKLFPIHRSFKFNPIVIERGGETESVRAAFMRHDVNEWARPGEHTIDLAVDDIERFAPKTFSFMELRNRRDLNLVEKIYARHPLLDSYIGEGLGALTTAEFHMSGDDAVFVRRSELEADGLVDESEDTRDPRVRARLWNEGYAPLYEGKSFWLHDPYALGNGAPGTSPVFVDHDVLEEKAGERWLAPRIAFRNVASSTNQRTLVSAVIPPAGHGHSCSTLAGLEDHDIAYLAAILSSMVIDYLVRMKVSANLSWFYLETLPIPRPSRDFLRASEGLVWRLNAVGADFEDPEPKPLVSGAARMAARLVIDALVAKLYSLSARDMKWIASRFPIYDSDVPEKHRYPKLAEKVTSQLLSDGLPAARQAARDLTTARHDDGFDFGLDELWTPDGGWKKANEEAAGLLAGAAA